MNDSALVYLRIADDIYQKMGLRISEAFIYFILKSWLLKRKLMKLSDLLKWL